MKLLNKKSLIIATFILCSSTLISCEHVEKTSTTQESGKPSKPSEFKFYVGSKIKPINPLIPTYTKLNEVLFTEDTNSETETLAQLGLTLDENTGVISGIPLEKGIGTATITIVAKNKTDPTQNAPSFQLNITTALETCPADPTIADSSSWKVIHGSATTSSPFEFRYSHLEKDNKMTCVYERKRLTSTDLFLVLEKENKLYNPLQYAQKHTDQWALNSSQTYYCQPKSSDVTACPFY